MATPNEFPIGIRVLAIDNDPICLKLLENLLIRCQYHVVATTQASIGLRMLRENMHEFDLVITDIHMADMDGFMLLQIIIQEFGIPVIISSVDGARQTVAKAVVHGACQYLLKPVRMQELRNVWQHVLRKKLVDGKLNAVDPRGDFEENYNVLAEYSEGSYSNDFDASSDDNAVGGKFPPEVGDSRGGKRPRISWTLELHQKFLAAINELGIDKAVPKKILDLMNVENLTREKVASHLQKYRQYVRRLKELTSRSSENLSKMKSDSLDVFRRYHAVGRMRILPPLAGVHMLSGAAALGHMPGHFVGSYQSFGSARNNLCRPNSTPLDQLGELQQRASGLLGSVGSVPDDLSWLQGSKPRMADGEVVVVGDRSSATTTMTMTPPLCEDSSFDFEIDFPELDRCLPEEAWQNINGEHLGGALPGFASSSQGSLQAAMNMDEAAQSCEINEDREDSAIEC